MKGLLPAVTICIMLLGCAKRTESVIQQDSVNGLVVDNEMVDFTPHAINPVFSGTGIETWDKDIRERGFILREDDGYHLWYTGYREGKDERMHLGYATSTDGISWTRYEKNPIVNEGWVEDMMVVKKDSLYHMFAEGREDIAHLLTSHDRVNWTEQGSLNIKNVNGTPLSAGPYGTPTAWYENDTWYLFYERGDLGIWLATSKDLKIWTNVQDEPVIKPGPELYDKYAVAVNQIVKHKGNYYAYYHATAFEDWHDWTSCVAISKDLIHWEKYKGNPILTENKSSPILVPDGIRYRLYSMHPEVVLHVHSE